MSSDNVATVLGEVDKLLLAQQYQDAIERLDQARQFDPSNPGILERFGDAHLAENQPDKALNAYDEALAGAPERAKLWAKRGDALLNLGRTDDAIAAFEKASGLAPDEFTELDWALRGDRRRNGGDPEAADRLYRKSLEVKPNVDAWYGLGSIESAAGRANEALAYYDKGLSLDPQHPPTLNDRGLALRDLGRRPEAVECFKRIVEKDPQSLQGWLNLGLVLYEQGLAEPARDAYVQARELNPDRSDTWLDLGVCQIDIGERDQAMRTALSSFERAVELDSNSFWGWNNAGWILGELGEYDKALAWLDRAIMLKEGESTPWRNKARVLARYGQATRARALLEQMIATVENRVEALDAKSFILSEMLGDDDEALKAAREASELAPADGLIAANLAELLVKVGDYNPARKKARALLDKDLKPDVHCAMLFVVYASYVLQRRLSSERASSFRDFIDYYRANFVEGSRKMSDWNYGGLLRAVRDKLAEDEEEAFLLAMAMDLQTGKIEAAKTGFFAVEGAG